MLDLVARMRADLTTAMKARDTDTVRVLRVALAAIANAEAQPVVGDGPASLTVSGGIAGAASGLGAAEAERRTLTEDDVRSIIRAERDERPAETAILDRYL